MKIIVLGSGIIGISTAFYLASNGHQVIVLDKNSKPAMGCSYGNGGQLSYSHVSTWPREISIKKLLKSIAGNKIPVSINKFDKKTLTWLYKFYTNSNFKTAYNNSLSLFYLSSYSKDLMKLVLNNNNLNINQKKINYSQNGILHFFRTKEIFDQNIDELKKLNFLENSAKILNVQQCIEHEVNLIKLYDQKKLAGGILYHDDATAECHEFALELEKICKEKLGVIFKYGVEIKNILNNHSKVTGINTTEEVFTADNYVYALGSSGDNLLTGIGIETNILPVRGYSLSINCNGQFSAPSSSLTDVENKIVYSKLGEKFRVAGIAEFSANENQNINQKSYKYLESTTTQSFTNCGDISNAKKWNGYRPFRPNSIPLICKVKNYPNLYLNTGHGSLGWTLSLASGKIISDLIDYKVNSQFEFLNTQLKN